MNQGWISIPDPRRRTSALPSGWRLPGGNSGPGPVEAGRSGNLRPNAEADAKLTPPSNIMVDRRRSDILSSNRTMRLQTPTNDLGVVEESESIGKGVELAVHEAGRFNWRSPLISFMPYLERDRRERLSIPAIASIACVGRLSAQMIRCWGVLLAVALTTAAYGQLTVTNPLDELRDQVGEVLADAGVPFTREQGRQLALLLEEQRQASEDLFGIIMDFSAGPPQGEDRDRALAGIQWMHDEFRRRLPEFLTPDQRAVWEEFESEGTVIGAEIEGAGVGGAQTERIQQIRIVNNSFNAETATSGSRGPGGGRERTEVIQRGGTGTYHGNFMAMFQDEALNARNPFADNKPPYYERTINGNFSGPLLRNRLTIDLTYNDNRRENVGTVKAETPDGPFALGITRPDVNRFFEGRGIAQLREAHALHFGFKFGMDTRKNQSIGNFTLPERGSNSEGHNYDFDVRQISELSGRTVHEARFAWRQERDETYPITTGVAINVLDAFNGGGAQSRVESEVRTYEFGNLLYHVGNRLTLRAGFSGSYRREHLIREKNFLGEFKFSDLESFRNGRPSKYRVTRGDPELDWSQFRAALFVQNDLRLTNRFTLFLGLRYEGQTNLPDNHNLDPRLGFAYALGSSTVIRGGMGVFHSRLGYPDVRTLLRLDGTRQFDIEIENPGWPDPFVSGNVTINPPSSRRVASAELGTPYYISTAVSLEQSLPANLFITVGYNHNRGIRLLRSRNLNAPLPDTGKRPFPDEGQIYELGSEGYGVHQSFTVNLRQRFSIFAVTAGYRSGSSHNDDSIGGNAGTEGIGFRIPANSYDRLADWGRTGFLLRHQFSAGINSRLPLDVYVNTAITANSGNFYTVTTGRDDNNDGVFNDRPPAGPWCPSSSGSATCIRNSENGPHFFNISFNVSKAFELGGGSRTSGAASGPQVNVFSNVNNAFNMTHLGTPSGVRTSPFFGRSFSAREPREIEAGLRFQF